MLLSLAYLRAGERARAEEDITNAQQILSKDGANLSQRLGGELLSTRGVLDLDDDRLGEARKMFQESSVIARQTSDRFLETRDLQNLSVVALQEEHYEDALDRSHAAAAIARSIGAQLILEKALGNEAWATYKLGDYEGALDSLKEADGNAKKLGAFIDRVHWLNNAGLCEYHLQHYGAAGSYYRQSLAVARMTGDQGMVGDTEVLLAALSIEAGDLDAAAPYVFEAESIARSRHVKIDELPPRLLEAELLTRRGRTAAAAPMLLDVERQAKDAPSLQWDAQHVLAKLYEDEKQPARADAWFRRAIQTLDTQRSSLSSDDTKLPFSANGEDLYLDYIAFLIEQRKTNEALAVLDQGRGQTLAEDLGVQQAGTAPRVRLAPQALAHALHGTILVYRLAPHASYLWAIDGAHTSFYTLPGKAAIVALLAAHRRDVMAAKDLLAKPDSPARTLYDTLVKPARTELHPGGRVFVIADEGLNGLNFETLVTPGAQPHYWIEDATITNARSLSLLAASLHRQPAAPKRLLLVGDPVYGEGELSPLPHAATEVNDVADQFPAEQRLLFTGARATPAAYTTSKPDQFAYIHFVAHGTASEVTPLDSAVILSGPPNQKESAKLYAREILSEPLRAELVTISACRGSGTRAYAGEGLVGLAWAFLRAGSHHVIGALWDVSDDASPQLMDHLYSSLTAGAPPDEALRAAKLQMLHAQGIFRKPIYWGAFQLYS